MLSKLMAVPLQLLLSHEQLQRLGLRSILNERLDACSSLVLPPVLDVCCGRANKFARDLRKNGLVSYGADIRWSDSIDLIADAAYLPIRYAAFNTVTFIGSFNYLREPKVALLEARRVLQPGGLVIITYVAPFVSWLRHLCAWWNHPENQIIDGMRFGFHRSEVAVLLRSCGFTIL